MLNEGQAYLEVQTNQRKDQRLQVLHEVVEDAQALRVFALVDVDQGADLGRFEGDVLRAEADLEFLPPVFVLLRPFGVVFSVAVG